MAQPDQPETEAIPVMTTAFPQPLSAQISGASQTLMTLADLPSKDVAGSSGNDTINGSDEWREKIHGWDGHDILRGMGGDDTLLGHQGNDTLDGGSGIDDLWGGVGDDVYWTDGRDLIHERMDDGYDTIIALANVKISKIQTEIVYVEELTAARFEDGAEYIDISLTIDVDNGTQNNILNGNVGNNRLDGGLGADTLKGGIGDDTYIVRDASVFIEEFAGRGYDKLEAWTSYTLGSGVSVEELAVVADQANVSLTGNEINNKLIGNAFANTLNGGDGVDMLEGGAGDDTYVVDKFGDVIVEGGADGSGNDTVVVTGTGWGEAYTLGQNGANVENVTLADSVGAILLIGNSAANILRGNSSDNVLRGGAGADTLDGGAGIDIASYADATEGLIIDVANTAASTGIAKGDQYISIEVLVASEFADTISGTGDGNAYYAGRGNDLVRGLGGNDFLAGQGDNDTLDGGEGADELHGDDGIDEATYINSNAAVVVDLQTGKGSGGEAEGDTYFQIENIRGSQHGDKIIGNSGSNVFRAEGGNDTLIGGGGDDTLDGGNGDDTAEFTGTKAEYTIKRNDDGTYTVTDNKAGRDGKDQLKSIKFAKFADQTLELVNSVPSIPSLVAETVSEYGAVGTLVGTLSATDADGDTVSYELSGPSANFFTIDGNKLLLKANVNYEAATSHQITVAAKDTHGAKSFLQTFIIRVGNETTLTKVGKSKNDRLNGTEQDDILKGGKGNDTLKGLGGDDRLYGDAGNDKLYGGAGLDAFVFNSKPVKGKNVDRIYDFNSAEDSLWLDNKIFKKLGKLGSEEAPMKLDAKHFATGKAKDKDDYLVYKGGTLYYDADGKGKGKMVEIVKVKGLTADDLFIV